MVPSRIFQYLAKIRGYPATLAYVYYRIVGDGFGLGPTMAFAGTMASIVKPTLRSKGLPVIMFLGCPKIRMVNYGY
jgi:hypothetical protein